MPKLAMSRRHRRQSNLAQCWNSPASSTTTDAGGSSEPGGIVRAAARMVSDEDMHQTSAASCPSPLEQSSSPKSLECWSGTESSTVHLQHPNRPKHSLKRPSPSMCLSDLAVASYSASSCSSPRVRPKLSFLEPAETAWEFSTGLLSPASFSPSSPASPTSGAPASPCSPWGHFVDLVPPENESMMEYDTREASVPSSTCGRRGAAAHPTGAASRRLPSSTDSRAATTTSFLPSFSRPNDAAALGRRRCCENESPYESALLARRRLRFDGPKDSPAASAAGSVSSESLSGFVLSFPPTLSSLPASRSTATTSLQNLDLHPNDTDLRLLMEDARTQFGNLTVKR